MWCQRATTLLIGSVNTVWLPFMGYPVWRQSLLGLQLAQNVQPSRILKTESTAAASLCGLDNIDQNVPYNVLF